MTLHLDVASPGERIVLPASYAQELLFRLQHAQPDDVAYNVARTFDVRGTLDRAAFENAVDALAERHEILRTRYAQHGDETLQIIDPARHVAVEWLDRHDIVVADALRERAMRPFDLTREAPFRVSCFAPRVGGGVVQIVTHHIASDGWSGDVMMRDLATLYAAFRRGDDERLAELPIQYGDYAVWERETIAGARLDRDIAYWRAELQNEDEIALPTDFPRPAHATSAAVSVSLTLDERTRATIDAFRRSSGATTYMVLLAAFGATLHRWSGAASVFIGSPIAGRAREETHGLIGYFARTVIQRVRIANDTTFAHLVATTRASALRAYDHHDVPFEKLMAELGGTAAVARPPLHAVFTMLDAHASAPIDFGDCTLVPSSSDDDTTKFDLTLFAREDADGTTLTLRGRSQVYARETLAALLARMQALLEAAATAPDERVDALPFATAAERAQLARWNATDVAFAAGSVADMIRISASRTPDRVAVSDGERALSYGELIAAADALAGRLRAHAVRGATVAVVLERSVDFIVAVLGTLFAGAAYVPLDPAAPDERLKRHMDIARCVAVIGAGGRVTSFDRPADTSSAPSDIAYVLFTSGSSGEPKGVTVTHANLANYVRAIATVLADGNAAGGDDGLRAALDGWRFAMVSTPAADLGNTALYPALCFGGTLTVLPHDVATDPQRFDAFCRRTPIDVLKITPGHLRALADTPAAPLPQRWLVFGGETLPWTLADRVTAGAHAPRVLNHYGPTETTVGATTFEITAQSSARARASGAHSVPIGRPLANVRTYAIDPNGNEQPPGVAGELFITGAGVAGGYLNPTARDAARFTSVAEFGHGYRTGDRVRRLPSGDLEFLGRFDRQRKIRGYRVEPAEVEATLASDDDIAHVAVVVDGEADDARLLAFVVPAAAGVTDIRVRERAAARLPAHLVPSAVRVLDALPMTANGKIDRDALLRDARVSAVPADTELTPTESALATIWSEVLGCGPVSASDDFFALGGHSLLAIRVLGKISRVFHVRLALRSLFDTPVLRDLARAVDVRRVEGAGNA